MVCLSLGGSKSAKSVYSVSLALQAEPSEKGSGSFVSSLPRGSGELPLERERKKRSHFGFRSSEGERAFVLSESIESNISFHADTGTEKPSDTPTRIQK